MMAASTAVSSVGLSVVVHMPIGFVMPAQPTGQFGSPSVANRRNLGLVSVRVAR